MMRSILVVVAVAGAVADDCVTYNKEADGKCGDVCLPASIGVCPRSIVVSTGGLKEGDCKSLGYTVDAGEVDQKAGPCGILKIEQHTKPALDVADDCDTYNKESDGSCGDVCLPATIGVCPRSIVVSTGGLKKGDCKSLGYTVDAGEVDQKAGPCGTLHIEKHNKPSVEASDDCETYNKESDGSCGDVCLPATIGVCPRSIVVSTGGLKKGDCKSLGYTVDAGEVDQKAGPCGTLHIEKHTRPSVEASDDCETYNKESDGSCGDVCLPTTIGVCPRSIVVSTGGLKKGDCKSLGYTVDAGEVDQKAGPCGTLHIEKHTKPSVESSDDCETYNKESDGSCGDVCLPATIGVCPRSIVVSTGGLKKGDCKSLGYTVDAGEVDQKAGPCGTLHIEKHTKPSVDASDDCETYNKESDGSCGDVCLPATIGVCPRSIVVSTGGLKKGDCKSLGYTVDAGEVDQKAGPCGTLHIEKHTKPFASVFV